MKTRWSFYLHFYKDRERRKGRWRGGDNIWTYQSLLSILLTGSIVCIMCCLIFGFAFISLSKLFSIRFYYYSSKLRFTNFLYLLSQSLIFFDWMRSLSSSYAILFLKAYSCSTAFLFFYWLSFALSLFLLTHWHFLQLQRSSPLNGHLLNNFVI